MFVSPNMYSTATAPPQPPPAQPHNLPPETCSQGHRTTLILPTTEGGSICLLCLSNLLSNPKSPTVHVSYALSQLSQAISQPQFIHSLLTFHSHFLILPLVSVLSNFEDEPIAKQTVDLVVKLCEASNSNGNEDVCREFIARVSDWISIGSLAWSRRQLYMLHCFGVLLDNQEANLYACIKNKDSLILNLITGLQLSSEEIQGEIMFVLYKVSLLQYTCMDDGSSDVLLSYCHKILHLSLNVLVKSQNDDVRLNCVAFLTVLARRGFFQSVSTHGSTDSFESESFMKINEQVIEEPRLEVVFAEAVKGPLLSSDSHVQIATLDLILLYLSSEGVSGKELQAFIEENIADYIYEILRLSGTKDPIVNSSIRILDALSAAEHAFRQRLAIGLTTLIPILRYVAGVPFHPVQCQVLKLIFTCLSNCPGIVSTSNAEEISIILAEMFKKHLDGEIGMLPETFTLSCSVFVALMKSSSSRANSVVAASTRDASRSAISALLGNNHADADQILYYLYLLKEAYAYDHDLPSSSNVGLRVCIIDICKLQILPWFMMFINESEEEAVALGVVETFDSVLLKDSNIDVNDFVDTLVSSSWFSVLFGCLGLFPSEKMKWRVYLIFGSIVDVILGNDSGQSIRDAAIHLPSDPTDLLFLLGRKGSHNLELFCCQSAVILLLYVSSLYNDRIADDKLVLASLEQYILLNSSDLCRALVPIEFLVNLYGLYRGFAKMSYQVSYSREAEKILFNQLAENDWDSFATRIHFTALKWLFQQEKLCKSLSAQMLKFCRDNSATGSVVVHHKSNQKVDLHVFAELVLSGDSFLPRIFVCLLGELVENANEEHDIISVVKAVAKIIDIAPAASDQFCMHGIDVVLEKIYNHYSRHYFPDLSAATSRLVFMILKSIQPTSISNNEAWTGVTMKLIDQLIPAVASDPWNEEIITITAILSVMLHYSTKQTLVEASKTILLNAHLISMVNITISEACLKGPALFDHDEGTKTGETIIFVLLLFFFSLKSLRATLPGLIDFQIFLEEGGEKQPLSYVSIRCHDLCKLMHFGSSPVKLVASFCLAELFAGISDYTSRNQVNLKFREGYLLSVSSILEGLIFYSDITVALNCSRCLSIILGWDELTITNNWGRLIVEELVMILSTPTLTSNLFMIHHKPAVNVAVVLLRLCKVPPWMVRVLNESAIFSIIQNISPSNVSTELVVLFRELLKSGYLTPAHITDLNQAFQACRRHVYRGETQDGTENYKEKADVGLNQVGEARLFLFRLVSSQLYPDMGIGRSQASKRELLEEIELFTKCLMEEDEP